MASASEEYIRQTQSQSNPHFQVTSTENCTSVGRRGQKNKKKGSKSPVKEGSNYYEGKHRQKADTESNTNNIKAEKRKLLHYCCKTVPEYGVAENSKLLSDWR